MIYTVFEDQFTDSLFPLNLNRAAFELHCGVFTNINRINRLIKSEDQIELIVRDHLKDVVSERYPKFVVNPEMISPGKWLNGAGIWTKELLDLIKKSRSYSAKGRLMAHHSEKHIPFAGFYSHIENVGLVTSEIEIKYFENIWDGIYFQSELIIQDSEDSFDYKQGNIHPSVAFENSDNIFTGEGSKVRAGGVLDARNGPIIIDKDVIVDIGALIQGPVYIGVQSIINPGAKIRGNVAMGPKCKIGGEVEDIIIQGYSNKQHDGFLGHCHLGEWVNIGANTNNSDLKNNYGMISLTIEDKNIETKQQFLGSIIGDFVRTGISTMLNTGTVIGIGANVFGEGFQNKYIPSFSWGKDGMTEFDKFIKTVEIMKQRRNMFLTKNDKSLLLEIYEKNIKTLLE